MLVLRARWLAAVIAAAPLAVLYAWWYLVYARDASTTVPPGGKIACADEIYDSPLARATPQLADQLTAGRSGSLIPRTGGSLSRRSASSW